MRNLSLAKSYSQEAMAHCKDAQYLRDLEPLLYVRDRLGHSDVSTTTIYLHLINSLEGHLILAHEDEIDQLFASTREAESA